jgi:RNA polymerase sigma-70 factor, ECF subfamily
MRCMREIDGALVSAWRRGDEAGTRALFEAVYPYAVRMGALSGLGIDEARECAQDVFTHAYERRSQLRDPQAFPLWFHRILTRAILDRATRRQRLREAPLGAADGLAEDWQRNSPGQPDELALEAERREQVWRQVQGLEPRARLAIMLRYYGDCSTQEVAQALGIREGAARTLLSRALARLRQTDADNSARAAPEAPGHDDPMTCGAPALERITAIHAFFDTK